jgi:hypothetical protein
MHQPANIPPHATRDPAPATRRAARRRGAGAIMAMMFLVIFGSLAAAMAIVSQGNLHTAEAHLKINRSLAAAETGMQLITYRLEQVSNQVTTRDGIVEDGAAGNAHGLWLQVSSLLVNEMASEFHNLEEPYTETVGTDAYGRTIVRAVIGPVALGPDAPSFTATLTPHPIAGEDYDALRYQREPYSSMSPAISSTNPLDARFIRVAVTAHDGPANGRVYRTVEMDFQLDKKIRFAILSRSRVMIGRNVMIDGAIGSRFQDVHLNNGHPVQMMSDFRGLTSGLDANLDALVGSLIEDDQDGDNRLSIYNSAETADFVDPASFDIDDDGYITDFDFFLSEFDSASSPGQISLTELEAELDAINAAQLLELIDTFGDPNRVGYNDGFIDANDRYAKIRGEVRITADVADWNDGAADGAYQDHFQGPLVPDYGEDALTFGDALDEHEFEADDFDTSSFAARADGDLLTQAQQNVDDAHDPADSNSPQPLGEVTTESVPFGAAYPYDYYERPVFRNMTFRDITIPQGTNALFVNCHFIGTTFIETATDNSDENFNYAGMQEPDGEPRHADRTAIVNVGGTATEVTDTKTVSNNIRFDNCTFEGSIVSDSPDEYTHTRNKLTFTGTTDFLDMTDATATPNLTEDERRLYRRSTILAPHYSVEMGTFVAPHDNAETVHLSGTIVAGLIDMRGQVEVNGTILTTFEPQADTGPVLGDTSPQFNTTLGYFSSAAGDMEAELPTTGFGVIQVTYDETLPLPDGILGPIETAPLVGTYWESAGQ